MRRVTPLPSNENFYISETIKMWNFTKGMVPILSDKSEVSFTAKKRDWYFDRYEIDINMAFLRIN